MTSPIPLLQSHYTPFDCLPTASQTPSGLLDMLSAEVEVLQRPNIELRSGMMEPMVPVTADGKLLQQPGLQWMDRMIAHQMQITTHRIVFWKEEEASSSRTARYLHLSMVVAATAESRTFLSLPKILVSSHLGPLLLVFRHQQERDQVLQVLKKTLTRKEWEKEESARVQQQQMQASIAHKVGVDAILAKNRMRHEVAAQVTQHALEGDAENLLKEATELVAIIHRYVATLDKHENNNDGNDASSSETAQLASLLQNMGMTSALNKADFQGRLDSYYNQVARQLADVLRPKIVRQGGVMTLTDAYCFYNRARASNLLSPEDMRRAVDCMDGMKLGLSQRVFSSGLVVLQDDSVSDKQVAAKLVEWAAKAEGINDLEVARLLKTSAMLAHEQLLAAEQMGMLVRDETMESVNFFPNRFEEWIKP